MRRDLIVLDLTGLRAELAEAERRNRQGRAQIATAMWLGALVLFAIAVAMLAACGPGQAVDELDELGTSTGDELVCPGGTYCQCPPLPCEHLHTCSTANLCTHSCVVDDDCEAPGACIDGVCGVPCDVAGDPCPELGPDAACMLPVGASQQQCVRGAR